MFRSLREGKRTRGTLTGGFEPDASVMPTEPISPSWVLIASIWMCRNVPENFCSNRFAWVPAVTIIGGRLNETKSGRTWWRTDERLYPEVWIHGYRYCCFDSRSWKYYSDDQSAKRKSHFLFLLWESNFRCIKSQSFRHTAVRALSRQKNYTRKGKYCKKC